MGTTVTLPLWLVVLLGALAAGLVVEHAVLPALRWYLRRKVSGVLEEIRVRLNIEVPPFKLTRRRALIDRLTSDPRILAAAQEQSADTGQPMAQTMRRIHGYAREIVPAFNAYVYFRIGYWLAKTFAQAIYRVRLGASDAQALAAIDPKSSVVFVMNHRSNMDYILVSFLAAERVALSYAVGEWARVWPLQGLIRSMGAYFVRRSSGDPLYRMVLQRYVQMATEGGVPQAMYPEGGLTVDGRLREPRFGLLDYMLKGFNPDGDRDLVFIPVGINYDRVLEDRTQLLKLDPTPARPGLAHTLSVTLRYLARQAWFGLTGRRYRNGYACVNFGLPVSMRALVRREGVDFRTLDDASRRDAVARVGALLMEAIAEIVPVLPVPLVAQVLLREPERAWSSFDLSAAVHDLVREVEARGARVYVPRSDFDYALAVGLRMLTMRRLIRLDAGHYRVEPAETRLLAYYANSIAHLCAPDPAQA